MAEEIIVLIDYFSTIDFDGDAVWLAVICIMATLIVTFAITVVVWVALLLVYFLGSYVHFFRMETLQKAL